MATIKEQLKELKKAAKKRGLKIRKDKRLRNTPYRAMNPMAAKELKQPCPPKTITYGIMACYPKRRLPLDIRHEIIEYDEMRKGKKYRTAHKIANRKQRDLDYV